MEPLRIKLLGRPEVESGDRKLRFRSRREQALLFYLATEGGMHERDKLAELLWPESRKGRDALRNALAGLRKTLREDSGTDHVVTGSGYLVGFDTSSGAQLDLRLLDAATPAPVRTEEERVSALASLSAAVEAYRGEFLEGFSLDGVPEFDYWADVERERWRRKAEAAFDRLSILQLEAGEAREAATTAERWATHAPSSEDAVKRLMEARFAAGDGAGALAAYEELQRALERGMGTGPGPETEALAACVRAETHSRPGPAPLEREAGTSRMVLQASLVGRAREFGELIAGYRAALGGARTVLVAGEAGIGKTRLVSEFLLWTRADGADVLSGGAFEASGRLPYGPVIDALRERLDRERAPADLLPDVWLSELGRILPEIRDRYPDLPPPIADESSARARLFEAVSALVTALAERAQVVLFLDDLQWADAATLDLLRYTARRWHEEGSPVLLVASARAEAFELDRRLVGWREGVFRDLPARSLQLGPLTGEDTVRLLESLAEASPESEASGRLERLGWWLYAQTGGQPFFLTETLGTLVERGVLVPEREPEGGRRLVVASVEEGALRGLLPTRVREVVRARIGGLDPRASELLAAAAVLGRGFGFEALCRVANLGEDECLPALDEALGSGLLREVTDVPDLDDTFSDHSYSFTHDRIRDVAYTEAGSARRRVFHRRALQFLEREGAPAAELAHHAFAAGDAGAAFANSLAAGDTALELFATEDAVAHYERAGRLLRKVGRGAEPPISEIERLYVNLGRARELAGDWDGAQAAYEAMRERGEEGGESSLRWSAPNRLAILAAQRSDVSAGVALLEEALEIAEAGGDRTAVAETEFNLSQMKAFDLEADEAIAHGEKALHLSRELGLTELEARTFASLATAHGAAGNFDECAASAREGANLYAQMGDDQAKSGALSPQYIWAGFPPSATSGRRAMRSQCLCVLSVGEVNLGNLKASVEAGREAVRIGREIHNEWAITHGLTDLSPVLIDAGEYEEVLRLTREAMGMARVLPSLVLLLYQLAARGSALQALLRIEEAREAYLEALSLVERASAPRWKSVMVPKLCANRALAGDWEAARGYALESLQIREEVPSCLIWMDFERHHETEALLRGGEEELAREDARRLGERIGENRRHRIVHLRMLAVLARHDGEIGRAIGHLGEAAALAEGIGLTGELWRIHAALRELHEKRGETEKARQAASRASEVVETLAGRISEDKLREGFLAASQVRSAGA